MSLLELSFGYIATKCRIKGCGRRSVTHEPCVPAQMGLQAMAHCFSDELRWNVVAMTGSGVAVAQGIGHQLFPKLLRFGAQLLPDRLTSQEAPHAVAGQTWVNNLR
jgi:hypothetical protein